MNYNLFPIYFNHAVAFSLPIPWYLPWIVLALIGIFYVIKHGWSSSYSYLKKVLTARHMNIALPLIAGGGISNIIDRIFNNGGVVDFIDLYYWPVFNLADSAIVIGVILIIYHLYQQRGATYGKS